MHILESIPISQLKVQAQNFGASFPNLNDMEIMGQ